MCDHTAPCLSYDARQQRITLAYLAASLRPSARRGGKALAARIAVESLARDGDHVHTAGTGGQWCVTHHPVGFLDVKIPPSRSKFRRSDPSFDPETWI
jgi:hypothetical protein